jgi:hypothetical protein
LLVGLFVLLCAREGAARDIRSEGRIFLRQDEISPRRKVEFQTGFWPTAMIAVLCGIIATAIANYL